MGSKVQMYERTSFRDAPLNGHPELATPEIAEAPKNPQHTY